MEAVQSLEAAAKNSPAYGVRNGQKAPMGTGETLLGPVVSEGRRSNGPYNRRPREVGAVPKGSRRGP